MIDTPLVSDAGASAFSQSSALQQTLSGEDFLTLLVAQLQNQDPLSPMESQEFATDLAQFSSLERLVSIDDRLEQSIDTDLLMTQAISNTMSATLLGKEVKALGNTVHLPSEGSSQIEFELGGFADDVEIVIVDELGNEVRRIERNGLSSGQQSVEWDGKDADGNRLDEGNYSFQVTAAKSDGTAVRALPLINGVISSVRYENGSAVLIVGDLEIAFSDVLEIGTNP